MNYSRAVANWHGCGWQGRLPESRKRLQMPPCTPRMLSLVLQSVPPRQVLSSRRRQCLEIQKWLDRMPCLAHRTAASRSG